MLPTTLYCNSALCEPALRPVETPDNERWSYCHPYDPPMLAKATVLSDVEPASTTILNSVFTLLLEARFCARATSAIKTVSSFALAENVVLRAPPGKDAQV